MDDAEIAVLDLASGEETVLPLRGSYPHYVSTGHLVYAREGTLRAGTSEADGTLGWVDRDGRPTPVTEERTGYYEVAMSPDGRRLAVLIGWKNHDVWVYELARGTWTRLRPLLDGPGGQGGAGAAISPDGRWIAYATNDSGRSEIKVTSFPEPGAVSTVSSGGGRDPAWARNGAELFFYSPGTAGWMAARVRSGTGLAFEPARSLFSGNYYAHTNSYDLAPDGERFVMILVEEESRQPTSFRVVENWGEELKRLLPPR